MNDLIPYLDRRLDKLEEKVDHLLRFKWQIIGGAGVIATIASVVVSIIVLALFGSH